MELVADRTAQSFCHLAVSFRFINYECGSVKSCKPQIIPLTLCDLKLFKEIKKRNLKYDQKSEKQIDTLFIFPPLNNRSCQYQKQLNSIGKDPNYDLITPNGIIGHFIVFIEVEELGS